MTQPEITPGDRRPIASRKLAVFQKIAGRLARARVSANAISIAGMVAGIGAAAMLVATSSSMGSAQRLLFLATAGGIQLRLLANMLDGMVAIASGTASPVGELYNEIPDRISDTFILVGAGYAAGSIAALGWAAACMALFVTYIRAVGRTVGVPGLFQGPMSKSHRMFTLTVACLYLGLAPESWQPGWPYWEGTWPPPTPLPPGHLIGLMAGTLAIILLGTLITAVRRLLRIAKSLRSPS